MRFPEFEGEWKKKKLGDIANITGGGTPNTDIEEYWNGEIHWFTPSEIKSAYVDKSVRTITELGLVKSSAKLLPAGAILLTTRATIGEVAIAQKECCTNQGFQSLVVNDGINNIFIANWIKQNKNELTKRAKGSTFAEISKSEVEKIPLVIPNTDEQNKIAKFLTLLDERIATQNKIIEQYKSLIKGLTHFVLNGKQANTRLKDCVACNSSTLTESEFEGINGLHPVYGATGIIAYSSQYAVDENSILIIKDGASVGRVQYVTGKYSAIGTLNYLTAKSGFSLKYIYYLLSYFNFDKYKVGSGIPHIYFKDYGNELIYCPSIKEQNKIARILWQVEKKIDLEQILLDAYSLQKQYLLKNMLI
ncbi:restriction endonuclease subunit S [Dysgonomonas sp.]|uniref:restriction endonuclease subunit S n=1 Tax=Dysgonomonas sp. TaxID=1891233 RepID=UPI002C9BEDC2|nr:restriction endonuclease subunit S [Dysgonomonas sp.]HMM04526.1 restriction endonuclease subunit S [Dysgonomonas sp.]